MCVKIATKQIITVYVNEVEMYYYLHTNGQLIPKRKVVVDSIGAKEYFESDFVVKWWYIDSADQYARMIVEADELKEEK